MEKRSLLLIVFLLSFLMTADSLIFPKYPIQYCFGDIGCFVNDADFYHPLRRSSNLPPYERSKINVIYTVHTSVDTIGSKFPANEPIHILKSTLYDPEKKTKILIHGYLDAEGEAWYPAMVEALLEFDDCNVVTVDWKGGSKTTYTQAVANARVVGLEIAYLVNWLLHNSTVQANDVHIIGHSLGAHVAGYAGERITGLSRITGLDPAGLLFQYLPPRVRLDPSDARFVDVIHTDINPIYQLGLGLEQPCGHVDFYPNGGHDQPGCHHPIKAAIELFKEGIDYIEGLTPEQKAYATCSHSRSTQLFTDSLVSKRCSYAAYHCSSYEKFQEGSCKSCGSDATLCTSMGINADLWAGIGLPGKENIKLYIKTGTGPKDYCI